MAVKTVTRVFFRFSPLSFEKMLELSTAIENILEAEGLELVYGETIFLEENTREIAAFGRTTKHEDIYKVAATYEISRDKVAISEVEEA